MSSKRAQEILQQRAKLPIAQGKEAILREIAANDVTVILGETGSGKTTQIPQYLLESDLYKRTIAVTQPRRVAATSLAARVSHEQQRQLGTLIGYSVRFDEKSSKETRVKYLTDGMLMREMMGDPTLEQYSVVIVDEAHERTLRTDLILASLKSILRKRNGPGAKRTADGKPKNPLKVVVMSATLNAEKFSDFFKAKIVYVQGRQHPVTIHHTSTPQNDWSEAALRTFFQIHLDQPDGDVLVFLPGQEDIENLDVSLRNYAQQLPIGSKSVKTCQLYASLPNEQQSAVFDAAPPNCRKCILATNIAETSLTIPGVKYVIDCGKQKEKRHVSRATGAGVNALLTLDITKSSAVQRAGRAGREGKGYCYRLYTEDAFKKMDLSSDPEIKRTSLTNALLQLKCAGQDIQEIEFMDQPDPSLISAAFRTLFLLQALDDKLALTDMGRKMATYPIEPEHAAILQESVTYHCTAEIVSIIALMSVSSPLFPDSASSRDEATEARAKFRHPTGDHLTWLNVLRAYDEISKSSKSERAQWCRTNFVSERTLREANDIRAQLRDVCEKNGVDWKASAGEQEEPILRSLARGLVLNSALLQPDKTYKQAFGPLEIKIHPSSALSDRQSPALLYTELVSTTAIYARGVSGIPRTFLQSLTLAAPRTST
ncbi:P-loop containing nucleoside triphosphate hydrolase protein [Peniophora sp. CONT]|nr:P-loop containing nucleoside triphosphate hydrolase protein [Peniophora sp. CONT]